MRTQHELIAQEPREEEIFKNPDGSLYIPISIIENKLDAIFGSNWSFVMNRETFGKKEMTASGVLSYRIGDDFVQRSGTAAIAYGSEMRLTYPALEARVILNAAKKIGKWFGRDLNRTIEDVVIQTATFEVVDESEIPSTSYIQNLKDKFQNDQSQAGL